MARPSKFRETSARPSASTASSAATQVATTSVAGTPVLASSTWCRPSPQARRVTADAHNAPSRRFEPRVVRVFEPDLDGVLACVPEVAAPVDDEAGPPGRTEDPGHEVDEVPLPRGADVDHDRATSDEYRAVPTTSRVQVARFPARSGAGTSE